MVCRGISTKGTAYRATLDGNPVLMTGPNDTRVRVKGLYPGQIKPGDSWVDMVKVFVPPHIHL